MQAIDRIEYVGVESDRIRQAFNYVLEAFEPLHAHRIVLKKKALKKTTMQAQPLLDRHFFFQEQRGYIIHYSSHSRIEPGLRTASLPIEVLRGWFAHEMGHLLDYQTRPWYDLAIQGLGYLFLRNVRMGMEKTADMYALEYGFGEDILATKHFILSNANITPRYKQQIMQYYLSPAETEKLLAEHQEGKELPEEIVKL